MILIVSCFEFFQLLSVDFAIFAYFAMVVDLGTNFDYHTSQAALDLLTDEEINKNNLPELLFHSLNNKVKPCKSYNFDNQALPFDSPSYLFYI